MSSTKERRHFTGQEKVAVLRRHLLDATSRRRGGVTSLERMSCARFGDSKAWLRGHFEQFQ